jgi:hypothetical protein
MANQVAWLSKSIDGPCDGKLDRLTKGSFQLLNNSQFILGFLRVHSSFSYRLWFNEELLPQLPYVDSDLDLTNTPISSDIPNVGAKTGGVAMPHFYWQEQHNQLSSALYALLVSEDILHKDAKKSIKTVTTLHFVANGFRVIQQLTHMHHPQLANNQAPLFNQVREAYPTMRVTISAGEHADALMGYFMDFAYWEQQIKMYFESCIIRESEFHLLFMQGLAPVLQVHIKPQVFPSMNVSLLLLVHLIKSLYQRHSHEPHVLLQLLLTHRNSINLIKFSHKLLRNLRILLLCAHSLVTTFLSMKL